MISRADVEHIARLARVELSEAEKIKFEKDLSDILAFVEKLSEVDTSQIEPLSGGTNLENVMREDEASRYSETESQALIDATPRTRDGSVEVPAVFQDR